MYLNHNFCPYKGKSESGVTLWTFCPLRWLEGLRAMGCFASVVSPECWWVCYKSSQQLQGSWDCNAAAAEQRDALSQRIYSLGVVISRFVCVYISIYIWKNINSIPTSIFGWWQMMLMVIIIMHHFLLSAFFTHHCSEMDIKLFLSVPSFIWTAGGNPSF